MRTITRDIVGLLIISSDDKVLFGKHPAKAGGVYADLWIIPGGVIEEGETRIDALKREALEEVSIDISAYKAELIDDDTHGESEKTLKDTGERVKVKMNFFDYEVRLNKTADQSGAKPTVEFPELLWAPINDLATTNLAEPTADLMRRRGYLK